MVIRNVLNFIWALVFFQNSIWFLTDNWFPKSEIFLLKSSLAKKSDFWKINCQSTTRWNFGKRPIPRWNWRHFWLPHTFMRCWDYWGAQATYLKMALYLVSLYWGVIYFRADCKPYQAWACQITRFFTFFSNFHWHQSNTHS